MIRNRSYLVMLAMLTLIIVLTACSTTSKLENLGYSTTQIELFEMKELAKRIAKDNISADDYILITEHNKYYEKHLEYYLKLLAQNYKIEDIDKIVYGVNRIIETKDELATELKLSKQIDTQKIEAIFTPTLTFDKSEINASKEAESLDEVKKIIKANSVFDGEINDKLDITSDLDLTKLGTYKVTASVTDSMGYTATLQGDIAVVDKQGPKIEFTNDISIMKGDQSSFDKLIGVVAASDNFDGDVTKSIILDDSNLDINTPGTYNIIFKVSDTAGNETVKNVNAKVLNSVGFKEAFNLNKYTVTVNSCSFNRTDSEPADYFYQYYNADEGQTFIICQINIKNDHDIKRSPFEIFGDDSARLEAKVIYNSTYEYSDVAHSLENNWYDMSTNLAPLTSKTLNLTFEVPQEVENGNDVVIEFADYENKQAPYYLKLR